MSDIKDKSVAVVGLARTGLAVADLLLAHGARPKIFEKSRESVDGRELERLRALGVEIVFGDGDLKALSGVELVVPSPGVPPSAPLLAAAATAGIPVISEIELAAGLTDRPIVAVTGTNGKTTTVTVIGEMLRAGGIEGDVVGNIGRPLAGAISGSSKAPLVVEVSSFQLEFTKAFRPFVAVLMNLTPDHGDWHGDLDSYKKAKHKIFQAQQSSDWAVVGSALLPQCGDLPSKVVSFGGDNGVFIKRNVICQDIKAGPEKVVALDRLFVRGPHNHENVMAAAAVALIMGVSIEAIAQAAADFRGVEHRLEFVVNANGVRYFNDSKATNPAASVQAVNSFDGNVILLAGGRNKGNDFEALGEAARDRVKLAVLFGEAASDIERSLSREGVRSKRVGSLADAIETARATAVEGDIVLLSPACASFDMFRDYEERGRIFKELVSNQVQSVG